MIFFSFWARTTACCANPSVNFYGGRVAIFFPWANFCSVFFFKIGGYPPICGLFSPLHMTATVPPTTYHIYLRKYYLMSTTFFNVTIVWSTKSRASAIFLFKEKKLATRPPKFGGRTTACCANPSAKFLWSCRQFFFFHSANFCLFFFKNCLTIFYPDLLRIFSQQRSHK